MTHIRLSITEVERKLFFFLEVVIRQGNDNAAMR